MNTLLQQSVGGVSRATVFDIPLLVDLIARHVVNSDIYRCTLVSRQFRDAFQHRLYTCISIEDEAALAKFFRKEAMVAFSRHRSYVREVSTPLKKSIMHLAKEAELQCTLHQARPSTRGLFWYLTTFRYRPDYMLVRATDLELYSLSILLVLKTSPALQVLHVYGFANHSESLVLRLATIIRRKGHRLKYLCIEGPQSRIKHELFYTLLWSCAAVEVLHMGLGPHSLPLIPFAESLPTFKSLARQALYDKHPRYHSAQSEATKMAERIQATDGMEFAWKELAPGSWLEEPALQMMKELLQMCPFLESMVFPKLDEQDTIVYLVPIVANSMPCLRHLDLTNISYQRLGPCRLVQACKDLLSLTLGELKFPQPLLADAVVLGHGHSLRSLHIEKCGLLTSQQLNLILSNCPRLLSLYALPRLRTRSRHDPRISLTPNTKDVATVYRETGWSCRDLETLYLCYKSEDRDIGVPKILWRQIGQLRKLRDLKLHREASRQAAPVREKESVKQALSSWNALSDLRRLKLIGLKPLVDATWFQQIRNERAQVEFVLSGRRR